MLIKSITSLTLLIAFSSVSANEVVSQLPVELEGAQKTSSHSGAIVWKSISDGLSGFTLTLPKYGIHESLEYQDTAALFYLASVDDTGLSLVKDEKGEFELSLKPQLSTFQYRHAVTPAFSFGIGAEFKSSDSRPFLVGGFRSITGRRGLQQSSVGLSEASLDFLFTRTKLSANEKSEKVLSLSLNSSQTRMSYGWRRFEAIRGADLLAEIGFIDEDIGFGLQFEHAFDFSTAYIGSFTNTSSKETEAFWGIKYELGQRSTLKLESDFTLLSSSAQSLRLTRRKALRRLWRDSNNFLKR